MNVSEDPLVTVVTPARNAEQFLSECIESVLKQTYRNFEYIIVDDCSTDASLDIARRYARQDHRLRVERTPKTVGVMESHNFSFNLIGSSAKYCKVVSPEDILFPDCVRLMVEMAEANPSVGIVGSYQLVGNQVKWQGFDYPQAVVSGREICRRIYLGNGQGFGFGTPTSLLYLADLMRASKEFYPDSAPHSDASACFKHLHNNDYGFVHQVLSYGRIHTELESLKSAAIHANAAAYLRDLVQYGPLYLSEAELQKRLRELLAEHDLLLARNIVGPRAREILDYHSVQLAALGYPIKRARILKAAAKRLLRELMNPELAVRKILRKASGKLHVWLAIPWLATDSGEIPSVLLYLVL